MAMSDRACGGASLTAIVGMFLYYTVWAMLLPLFDEDSPVHAWFPAREWALRIPAFIVVSGITAMGLFLGVLIVKGTPTPQVRHKQS